MSFKLFYNLRHHKIRLKEIIPSTQDLIWLHVLVTYLPLRKYFQKLS